jgi:hypothetical protein
MQEGNISVATPAWTKKKKNESGDKFRAIRQKLEKGGHALMLATLCHHSIGPLPVHRVQENH